MKRLAVIFNLFSHHNTRSLFQAMWGCDIIMCMAVTVTEFRALLGSQANGLTDAEVERTLDWAYRFSDAAIEWWKRDDSLSLDESHAIVDIGIEEYRLNNDLGPRVMDEDDYWNSYSDCYEDSGEKLYAEIG